MTPSITINVDPTNPGQFFACCGLLEIAHRITGHADGWFGDGVFHVQTAGDLSVQIVVDALKQGFRSSLSDSEMQRLRKLLNEGDKKLTAEERDAGNQLKEKWNSEIIYPNAFDGLVFDWWNDEFGGGGKLKTWAGKQLVVDILDGLVSALLNVPMPEAELLFASTTESILTFYFNSLKGSHSSDIDVGFSDYALSKNKRSRMESPATPACEVLAFVGIQRFRPVQNKRTFIYKTWSVPSTPIVAAASQAIPLDLKETAFSFNLMYRTKYLKAFLTAQPLALQQQ